MKYRNISLGLIILAVMTLAGCACEHEWANADCLNPQVCAKCGEIGEPAPGHEWCDAACTAPQTCTRCGASEGDPLGHEWLDASCTAPETCARCSETRGGKLDHTYSEWIFEDDQMSKHCLVCNDKYTTAIDREVYLESLLGGFWDYWSIEHNDGNSHGGVATNTNYLIFGENRSCQMTMTSGYGIYKGSGTWQLMNYIHSESEDVYQIYVHTTSPIDEYWEIILHVTPDGTKGISFTGADHTRWFYQEQDDIIDGICTGWAIANHSADHSYCFRFRPDRTVTCYVEGVFEGTWSLGADPLDRSYVSYIIEYVRDGKPEEFKGYFYLPGEYYDVPTLELVSGNQIFDFHQVNDTELANIQDATDRFAGTWASTGFGSSNPKFADPATMDYSLSVEKDGSFALTLRSGKTYEGSWSAYAISEGSCQYYLYFTEQKKKVYCNLDTRGDAATLGIGETTDGDLFFTQVPEAYPVHSLPLGTWTDNDGHSITFGEDGTFTGLMDRELRGTWTFWCFRGESAYYSSDGSVSWAFDEWEYLLFIEGEAEPEYLHFQKDKKEGTFRLELTVTNSDGKRVTYTLTKD